VLNNCNDKLATAKLGPNSIGEVHAGESFNDRQRKVVNRLLDGFEDKLQGYRVTFS